MNMELLQLKIKESGLKQYSVASQTGISPQILCNRLKKPENWKVREIRTISEVLNLTESERAEIFGLM